MRKEGGTLHIDVTTLLRKLTCSNTPLKWTEDCKKSYIYLKSRVSDQTVLVYFKPDKDT